MPSASGLPSSFYRLRVVCCAVFVQVSFSLPVWPACSCICRSLTLSVGVSACCCSPACMFVACPMLACLPCAFFLSVDGRCAVPMMHAPFAGIFLHRCGRGVRIMPVIRMGGREFVNSLPLHVRYADGLRAVLILNLLVRALPVPSPSAAAMAGRPPDDPWFVAVWFEVA